MTLYFTSKLWKSQKNYQNKLQSITFLDQQNALVRVFLPLIQLPKAF